ncbi:MAG: 16S rRNA (adenine(1518)-N(6)/adenine(1519)-N(6))-dimethyltransferase RsmA [Candidatus Omnitrophota bacterium]
MDLKELREIWREHGFRPKKKLGQNFLIDKNVRDNLLRSISPKAGGTVIEIGAGFGVMSFLVSERCGKLIAVEKDTRICGIMESRFKRKGNITLLVADILDVDLCAFTEKRKRATVFGNIPYYVSTPIIEKIITSRKCVDEAYLVMQEELADRIVSAPGTRACGAISFFVQFYTKPEKLFRIKKNSFYPTPNVGSCLLKLRILRKPSTPVKDERLMFALIRKAFSERRKKIINPLSGKGFMSIEKGTWEEVLRRCGIDAASRAENLSLADYAKMADVVGEITCVRPD